MIRQATEDDWAVIVQHQERHLIGVPPDITATFPEFLDCLWFISNVHDKDACAIGWIELNASRQIVLLWNKGREEALAACELMKFTIDEAEKENQALWFLTHKACSPGALRAFEKWGFKEIPGQVGFSTYWRDI